MLCTTTVQCKLHAVRAYSFVHISNASLYRKTHTTGASCRRRAPPHVQMYLCWMMVEKLMCANKQARTATYTVWWQLLVVVVSICLNLHCIHVFVSGHWWYAHMVACSCVCVCMVVLVCPSVHVCMCVYVHACVCMNYTLGSQIQKLCPASYINGLS